MSGTDLHSIADTDHNHGTLHDNWTASFIPLQSGGVHLEAVGLLKILIFVTFLSFASPCLYYLEHDHCDHDHEHPHHQYENLVDNAEKEGFYYIDKEKPADKEEDINFILNLSYSTIYPWICCRFLERSLGIQFNVGDARSAGITCPYATYEWSLELDRSSCWRKVYSIFSWVNEGWKVSLQTSKFYSPWNYQ